MTVHLTDPLQRLGVVRAVSGVHIVQSGGERDHGEVLVLGGHHDQGDGEGEEPDSDDSAQYDRSRAEPPSLSPPAGTGEGPGEELLDVIHPVSVHQL